MRKIISLIFIIVLSRNARAQDTSLLFADKVREFLAFYEKVGYTKRAIVLEDPKILTDFIDSSLLNAPDRIMHKPFAKVNCSACRPKESVMFTKAEIEFIIKRMTFPAVEKWDSSFFPKSRFVAQSEVNAFHARYRVLTTLVLDSCKDCNYEDKSIITYAPYLDREKMRKDSLFVIGYSRISNPVFVRKGKFAIIYEYNSVAARPSWYQLAVYKMDSNGWSRFGYLEGAEF